MDSITQAALGASVGEVTLGRQLGRKAILLGAVVGTLPDLDVLAAPFLHEVSSLTWHRGYSHSIFVNAVLAVGLAWLLHRFGGSVASFQRWLLFTFSTLQSAVILDAFTVYGTRLLLPFTDHAYGFNTIAIVDPIFTLPLLVVTAAGLILGRGSRVRHRIGWIGLAISCLYLVLTVGIKLHVNSVTEQNIERQQFSAERYMTVPTIFNSILWRTTVETADGYLVGYHSLLDASDSIDYYFIPRNDSLLDAVARDRLVETLKSFSQGWYTVGRDGDSLRFSDLRFGEFDVAATDGRHFIFSWKIFPTDTGWEVRQVEQSMADPAAALGNLWHRLKGR